MKTKTYIDDPYQHIIYDLRQWLDYNITQCEKLSNKYAQPKHARIYEQLVAYKTTRNKLKELINDYII